MPAGFDPVPNPITVTVTTAGTQIQVVSSETLVRAVTFRPRAGNTGVVYIGDDAVSSANGFELSPGEPFTIKLVAGEPALDLSDWWIDAATNGDIVDVFKLDMEIQRLHA